MSNTITIGNITLGGALGEHPAALAGSIFYDNHVIVKDSTTGEFDQEKAAQLIVEQDEWSEKTGVPAIVDIVGSTPEAMVKYVEFVARTTKSPILIDGSQEDVRLAGMVRAYELGIMDRVVYNSISVHSESRELSKLKELGCVSAILLAYNPTDFSMNGRFNVVEKLLAKADEAGIKNRLIDTSVMDLPSLGMAKELFSTIKEKYGVLVGNSPHNAVSRWKGLKNKFSLAKESCTVAVHAVPAAWGADFLIYGPIRHAGVIFPGVGMVYACYGQLNLEQGRMVGIEHPLFKMV